MAAVDDLDQVIGQCQLALDEFVKGNSEPRQIVFSNREDVSLANPFGPPARGWDELAATMNRASTNLRDGAMVAFENIAEYVTPEPASPVRVERQKAKVGGRQDTTPFALQDTMIFRPEDGAWMFVPWRADPIVITRPAKSSNHD